MKKTALVLEGGAMRGMYSAAVLDVLMEEGIKVDAIYATSAGVLFGVNYISGQRGRAIRYNKRFSRDKRYMGIYSLVTSGNVINKDFAFYEVPFTLDVFDDEAYMNSDVKMVATVTNVHSGGVEYIEVKSVLRQMEVLRAASAMPFVSQMVELDGQLYLDGGLSDSIPLKKCQADGYERIIVVETRPKGYRKSKSSSLPAKLFYSKYPNLVETINNRYSAYNDILQEIDDLDARGEIVLVQPSKELHLGRIESDPERLQEMYDLGIGDAKVLLPRIKQFLSED
ncbi:MAG: patatin-like phospholipase family protein [Paludibacteraceae bacterium]|nr:patatin-like phospholipase family protein [Paludibacteraceae bacterium]